MGGGLLSPHIRATSRGTGCQPHPPLRGCFPLNTTGIVRVNVCPEQSTLGGGHRYYPSGQVGTQRPERGSLLPVPIPGDRGGTNPACLAFRDQDSPGPLPTSPTGQEEEELGGRAGEGGTPAGSGIVPGAAIQRNTGCQALPQPLWPLPLPQPGPLLGGVREDRAGQRPSPSPWSSRPSTVWPLLTGPPVTAIAGSFSNIPLCLCSWCPDSPFWAFSILSLPQMAPPPGSLPCPLRGSEVRCPLSGSQNLLGFPPPQPRLP